MLAHEFIKLRFGIFDEVGFPDDYLYPPTFLMNGEIYPTGVSNTQVEGNWVLSDGQTHCQPDNQTSSCVYQATGPDTAVSCSLGSYAHLPHVVKYCQPDQIRGPAGPTKQLVLCQGKFAWQIIESSRDFNQIEKSSERREERPPRIDFVREAAPSHVLVLEVSASMEENDDWKFINKAAHKLIRYDLPQSTRLGVVTFSNESRLEAGLTRVGEARDHLADIIPDKYRLAEDDGRCVVCGLNTAVNQVLGENKAGGHIVLVTRAGPDTLSITDQMIIREYVEYYQIKISVMMVPAHNQHYLAFYDQIAGESGGRAHLVQQDTHLRKYWAMLEAFSDICQTDTVTAYSQVQTITDQQTESSGSFLVPASDGEKILFGIIVEDEEDHLIDEIVFENEAGTRFGPYSHIATTFDNINMKTVSFGLGATQPFEDWSHVSQEWKYWVQWHRPGPVSREAVVMVTSSPKASVDITMWTSSPSLSPSVSPEAPLALFVSVTAGGSPVIGARVEVCVEVTTTDLSEYHRLGPLELGDSGNADPDMTAGDGVYSGLLTQYPAPGRYVFTVKVESVDNVTRRVRVDRPVTDQAMGVTCCGSRTTVRDNELVSLDPVRRESVGLVMTLITVPDPLSPVSLPPPRITDLRVELDGERRSLETSWTPPGLVTLTGYKLVISEKLNELLEPHPDSRGSSSVVLADSSLEQTDTGRVKVSVHLQHRFGHNFYLGVIGMSDGDISGKISNLVYVSIPQSTAGVAGGMSSSDGELQPGNNNSSHSILALSVCGSLLLVVLSLTLAVLFFLRYRGKKSVRTAGVAVAAGSVGDDNTDNTSCSDTTHNNSGNNLMPDITSHIQTISRPSHFFSAPPDTTPTYWSATKLLTEHEQRALAMSYAPAYPESHYYPDHDDDSLSYSVNSRQADSVKEGITNPTFPHQSHGTPVHGVFGHGDQYSVSVAEEMSEATEEQEEAPVRFSTGVQTIAPSAIATLRQNNTYLASLRNRNVSLV